MKPWQKQMRLWKGRLTDVAWKWLMGLRGTMKLEANKPPCCRAVAESLPKIRSIIWFAQFLWRMRRAHEETGIFKMLKKKNTKNQKPYLRLKNKCRFNNVGNKPKAATSPLGIETLSCDHGRITKQTRLPLLRPPWKKQAKLHWAKLLRLGFALQPCADTENLKWADSWALWLFSFIVLINKVSWCQVMRKTSRERMIFLFLFRKYHWLLLTHVVFIAICQYFICLYWEGK